MTERASRRIFSVADDGEASVPVAVREQAIAWFVRMASGQSSPADHASLTQWRAQDDQHERAWQRLAQMEQRLHHSPAAQQPTLTREALKQLRRLHLVGGKGKALMLSMALCATCVAAFVGPEPRAAFQSMVADERTATGEQRHIRLIDGSDLLLDTQSAVNLHFDAQERRVELISGGLQIVTAKDDSGRPFVVTTRDGTVTPLGTRFTVRREADAEDTSVTVTQGRVDISPRNGGERVRIEAGEQAVLTENEAWSARPLHESDTAWTDGVIEAEGMRLCDFVAELARYRSGVLRCDAAVANMRLTGAFPLDDSDRVLDAIERSLPVKITRHSRYWVAIGPR